MRILICDDDTIIIEQLTKFIKLYFKKKKLSCPEICSYTNGETLLQDHGAKDIVLLDVEMPGLNGIFIGNELKKQNQNTIIFIITSYTDYLDDAMRFHVFRYISKPVEKNRFFRNLDDALRLYHTTTIQIPVETKNGVYTISADQIIAIEAIRRKVIVHTTSKNLESIHNMNYWLEVLPQNCFFQTHRSFLVNFKHVNDFDHELIHMHNHQFNAYLTARKYTAFKLAYFLYLESTR